MVLSFISSCTPAEARIPSRALKFLPYIVKVAKYYQVDPATVAAQIHQESLFKYDAHSKYASGLAQFTPSTAKWISSLYPAELGSGETLDPKWAIRAAVIYDKFLLERTEQVWHFALRAYNGGLGYIYKEKKAEALGECKAGWDCCDKFRADWACKENLDYPKKILNRWLPLYVARLNHFGSDD